MEIISKSFSKQPFKLLYERSSVRFLSQSTPLIVLYKIFFITTPFLGLTLGLLSKFTFSRLKVAQELHSNFRRHKGNYIYKINIFFVVTSIWPKYHKHNQLASVNLKLKKLNYLLRAQPRFFVLAFFNVGNCLASCLTFRPFLTLDLQQLGSLYLYQQKVRKN